LRADVVAAEFTVLGLVSAIAEYFSGKLKGNAGEGIPGTR
jgi:hypothetical protein